MRNLNDHQWQRWDELVEHLEQLPAEVRDAALQELRAQGREDQEVLSLVARHFEYPLEPERCRTGEPIGNFTLGDQLGSGGMGVVYHARQESLGRNVALKLIHPALVLAGQSDAVERFQSESRLLAQCTHAHIATIYEGDIYVDPHTKEQIPFIAMQLVEGGVPLTVYAKDHVLPMSERLELFLRVCEAMQVLHQQNVIHRDLKPKNILVDQAGHPFVIDFGLARVCDPSRPRGVERVSGTPAYMSPEQVSDAFGPVTPRSDVYTLGVILYELLAERHPYEVPHNASWEAIRQAILTAVHVPLSRYNAECHEDLERIVTKALAKRPAERHQWVTDLHREIARYLKFVEQVNIARAVHQPPASYGYPKHVRERRDPVLRILVETSDYIRRERQLRELERLMFEAPSHNIVGIWGGPGVGKSALARYFATEYAARFPDGVVGLNARDKDAKSLALEFAEAIGEPVERGGEFDPLAIMQSRFAHRRALLILDSAAKPDVRNLIPGGNCTVLVTAQDRKLLDYIGAQAPIALLPFTPDESRAFLENLVGPQAIKNEEGAVRKLMELVGYLPLALRIVGLLVRDQAIHSQCPFSDLLEQLSDERSRLERLTEWIADDLNVQAVFRLSLTYLTTEQHRTFASLAACAVSGFNRETAAATAGLDQRTADAHLLRLGQLALVNYDRDMRRYSLHSLLRLFAEEEAREKEVWPQVRERHASFFEAYAERHETLTPQNLDELATEKDALLLTAHWKMEHKNFSMPFWDIVSKVLEIRGYWEVGIELMQDCLKVADHTHADAEAAFFYRQLGKYQLSLGKRQEAISSYRRSLARSEALGDELLIAQALNSLAAALRQARQVEEAIACAQRSLALSQKPEDWLQKAKAGNSLGMVLRHKEQYREAIALLQDSFDSLLESGDQRRIAKASTSLGVVCREGGRLDEAIRAFERSLVIEKDIKNPHGIAITLAHLAEVYGEKGWVDKACAAFEEAIPLYEELGNRRHLAKSRFEYAKILWSKGDFKKAIEVWQRTRIVQRELGYAHDEARTLMMLGRTLLTTEQVGEAISAFACAKDVYEKLPDGWRGAKEAKDLLVMAKLIEARSRGSGGTMCQDP